MSTRVRMPRSPKPLGLRFGDKTPRARKTGIALPEARQVNGPAVTVESPSRQIAPQSPRADKPRREPRVQQRSETIEQPEKSTADPARQKPSRAGVRHRLIDATTNRKRKSPDRAKAAVDSDKPKEEVRAPAETIEPAAPPPAAAQKTELRQKISVNRNRWLVNATSSPYAKRRYPKFMEGTVPRYAVIAGLATVITVAAGTFLQQTGEANRLDVPATPTTAEASDDSDTIDVVSR